MVSLAIQFHQDQLPPAVLVVEVLVAGSTSGSKPRFIRRKESSLVLRWGIPPNAYRLDVDAPLDKTNEGVLFNPRWKDLRPFEQEDDECDELDGDDDLE